MNLTGQRDEADALEGCRFGGQGSLRLSSRKVSGARFRRTGSGPSSAHLSSTSSGQRALCCAVREEGAAVREAWPGAGGCWEERGTTWRYQTVHERTPGWQREWEIQQRAGRGGPILRVLSLASQSGELRSSFRRPGGLPARVSLSSIGPVPSASFVSTPVAAVQNPGPACTLQPVPAAGRHHLCVSASSLLGGLTKVHAREAQYSKDCLRQGVGEGCARRQRSIIGDYTIPSMGIL